MRNLVKYSVFGSIVFTGSAASAWWCSMCNEDHKEGDVCSITGAKPCDKCHEIHKPGGICVQFDDKWENDKIEDIFDVKTASTTPVFCGSERIRAITQYTAAAAGGMKIFSLDVSDSR